MNKRPAALVYVLAMVMMLFIGILIYVWIQTKKANPVMLDEKGHPQARLLLPASRPSV
jgi:hypothetical protein